MHGIEFSTKCTGIIFKMDASLGMHTKGKWGKMYSNNVS